MNHKKKDKSKRRFQKPDQNSNAPIFERLEPRLLLSAVPYIQDFSMGKPGIEQGWEYTSDPEGRIEVVNGRLRMDDILGNMTFSGNEAILHVDLTGQIGVTLTLDHVNLSDEHNPLPSSFEGMYKGDGIALSVDGQHWVKVTDLTTSFTDKAFALDPVIQQAMTEANSTDLSDVQIKFQQYDNFPASIDGREFDNIRLTVVSITPEIELEGNGQAIADNDLTPDPTDGTDFGLVPTDNSIVRTFTIRNTGMAPLNLTGTPLVQLTGSEDFTVIQQPDAVVAAGGGITTFQVRFTASSEELKTALVQIASNDEDESSFDFTIQGTGTPKIAQAIPYTQDFSEGKPGIEQGWEYASDPEGRIEVVDGRLRMDDILGNLTFSGNEAILHVDLTEQTGVVLTLDHVNLSDEHNPLPSSFEGLFKGDGIVLSVDGQHWVKVTDLTTSFTDKSFALDTVIQQAMTEADSTDLADVQIKFQQYDNFPASTDGREFDNIRLTVVSTSPEIELVGNGQVIADNDLTPNPADGTDFGPIYTGGSLVQTYTIRNMGMTPLNLTGAPLVQLTGSEDFTVIQQPDATVEAGGGTTTFQIQFNPSSEGLKTVLVQIASNDEDNPSFDFTIQGTGLPQIAQAIPYEQDFSEGKPGIEQGWEYASDPEGRIEVVDGRLRMDDILGNTTFAGNEAILHVDLTDLTGVTLTLDHVNLSDEPDALPSSFEGLFKGDGIVLSVDGQHWVKVTDLTTSFTDKSFDLDPVIQLAMTEANSTDLSDVQIKFQQYDNFPASTDGREFDNIRLTIVTPSPEIELEGNGQVIADNDLTPDLTDGTDFGSIYTGGSIVRTYTIRNTGTEPLNLTGTPLILLIGSEDFTVIQQPDATVAADGGTTTFQVQFNASSEGLKTALIQIASNDENNPSFDFTIQGTGTPQIAQAVPYTQDFSEGKPGIEQGWEYASDPEGRIEVVDGRLRMDDISGNLTFSGNEAILHVDLTDQTGVVLTLDHVNLSDEHNPLPSSFEGLFKGDGIVLSVDGQHWVKVTDLTTSFTDKAFNLDPVIQQAMTEADSTDLADVQIKFQQYDNFPASTDGREFDNIRLTVISTLPEIEVVGNGQVIADNDLTPDPADGTDFESVPMNGSVVQTYTIRNTGLEPLNLTGTPLVQLTGSEDFTVVQQPDATVAADGGTTTFQVQFNPSSEGLKTALVQIASNDEDTPSFDFTIQGTGTPQIAQAIPYTQDFSEGKPGIEQGWEYASDPEGRIEVVNGRLRMDDISGNLTFSGNEAILHVDLTGRTGVTLTLDHVNLSDEHNPLPSSFEGLFKGDGIVLSVDGQNWVKVTDLTTSFTDKSFNLDPIIQQAMVDAESTDLSDVQIKFQQYDNYPASIDGREFDNIRIT